ncbi:MAG: hypothetical protein IME93_04335 [Proteobacteria bacterium]|nr:hypothetical protein [Pseudomonadota bacterium]
MASPSINYDEAPLPFSVTLENGDTVQCRQRVRVIPHRRAVCAGTVTSANKSSDNNQVFIKLYIDDSRSRVHWQREHDGLQLLAEKEIVTPEVLYSGATKDGKAHAIVSRAVTPSSEFLDLWQSAVDNNSREKLLGTLVSAVAQLHRSGLVQHDIHLRNFLVSGEAIYTLDGSDIISHQSMTKSQALSNLGLLAAQFEPQYDDLFVSLFRQYVAEGCAAVSESDRDEFICQRDQQRDRRKAKYLQKIFRQSTAFSAQQSFTARTIISKRYDSPELTALLNDPDKFIAASEKILKQGNSSTVALIKVGDRNMVIKRYNIKSPWHAVSRALRPTRAAVSWRNAHMLSFYGIPTAAPVAMLEQRMGPLRGKAYFVCEYQPGITARDFFAQEGSTETGPVLSAMQQIVGLLQRFRIAHGDMKATNFLVRNGRVWLIDLDGMRQISSPGTFHRAHQADIMRLLQNWEPGSRQYKLFHGMRETV